MPDETDGSLVPRVEKLETKVDILEIKVNDIDHRSAETETQLGRVMSHIESESGATRSDLARLENRLLGAEDSEYGGKIGHVARKVYHMEIWFRGIIVASGIIIFLFAVYEFLLKVKP